MAKKNKKLKGFSLLEAVASIFLVSFGIVGVLPLLSGGIRETFDSRDQMTATLLAQEGVEIMRNIRDNHWAGGEKSFPESLNGEKVGYVSYNSEELTESPCSETSDCRLKMSGNLYNHSNGTDTKFRRKIIVEDISTEAGGRRVVSIVEWKNEAFPSDVSSCLVKEGCVWTKTVLTDWGTL